MNFESNSETIKWICSIFVCVFSIIGSILPTLIRSQEWALLIDSFSGGILFATGFVHLLEDATDNIFEYGKTPYPVPGTTAVGTFSILTIVLVFLSSDKTPVNNNNDDQSESLKKTRSHHSFSINKKRKANNSDDIEQDLSDIDEDDESNLGSNLINPQSNQPNEIKKQVSSIDRKKSKKVLFGNSLVCFPIMTILFCIIFSMNAVLEGIKMGFISEKKEFITFSLFVFIRKIFEAFLLGLTLLESRPNIVLYFSITIVFSILFLVGTIFSILLKIKEKVLIFGILFSISAGTFIYAGVSKWAVMFLNRRKWSYSVKFWHLGLFSIAIVVIILFAIAAK